MRKWSFALACLFLFFLGNAQNSDKPKDVTNSFVIQNVNIIQKPGQRIDMGSIVIQDGIITQVGKTVNIPFDAEIISADSMFVYAGFIDALSHTGIPKDDSEKPKTSNPGQPTNEAAGIVPDKLSSSVLSAKEKSIQSLRNLGFGISHIVPEGNMMPGSGAIIVLNGKSSQEMILKDDVSLFGTFKGSGRVYPSTIIGVLAKWKDLYRNAEIAKKHTASYEMNPQGVGRPAYDAATRALFPVIGKSKTIFMKTPDLLSIHRAMKLQSDLGFNMALCEVKQGTGIIDKIKAKNHAVLLSIDIPKAEKKDEDKKEKKETAKDSTDTKKKVEKKKEELDPEMEAFKERKNKAIAEHIGQAAAFEKAGIPFSFSLESGKAKDLKTNLKAMIDAGLSESAALAGLTTNPAKLLGISNIAGPIEVGKMANLVMTDKSYFEEKSKIRYVFVEGSSFEFKDKPKKKKKKGTGDSTVNVEGKWSYKIDIPMPENEGTLEIVQTDDTYTVTMVTTGQEDDPEVIEDVELDGDEMSFSFEVTEGMVMTVEIDLSFSDDSFEGTVAAGQFGSFPITGNRISDPKN